MKNSWRSNLQFDNIKSQLSQEYIQDSWCKIRYQIIDKDCWRGCDEVALSWSYDLSMGDTEIVNRDGWYVFFISEDQSKEEQAGT
jgi:hypothetical protein